MISALALIVLALVLALLTLSARGEGWYELVLVVTGTLVLLGIAEYVSLRRTGKTISARVTQTWREGRRAPVLVLFLSLGFVCLWLVLHWLGLF